MTSHDNLTAQRHRYAAEAARARKARLEDLWDLANWNVPFDEAARRTGLRPESLHRYLQKWDPELSRILVANSVRRGLSTDGALVYSRTNVT